MSPSPAEPQGSPKSDPRGGAQPPVGPTGPERVGWATALVWIPFLILGYFFVQQLLNGGGTIVPYSAFRTEVAEGNVTEITMRGDAVRGVFAEPVVRVENGDTLTIDEFVTHVPGVGDDELLGLLEANAVEVQTLPARGSSWMQLLAWIVLPLVLMGAFFLFFMRGMSGRVQSMLSIGESGAKRYERQDSAVSFDDVAGAAGAKMELREIVAFLKDPQRFWQLGAEVPKGVLLVGPPGTGKTLLARAVAGEADVSFFIITGSDFMEMFVGVGAKRVRDLFQQAKAAAPSIVFIDELDSIGRHRGAGLGGGHDEREQTLNQLLSELDGFEPTENVIVMAATNRPDILDPALLRPGRFDRRITVDLPSASERLEVLRLHSRRMPLHPDVDLAPVANGTPGFSGADLKNLLNEAALNAAREARERIEARDIEAARDRVMLGLKREGLVLTQEEVRLLAYHEGGHALLGAVLPTSDPVHKVTIVPRGRSMGATHQLPERERYIWRRDELLDRITLMLGGRAAEELVFDTVTSGAEDDLQRATRLARRMVLRWGMSPSLGAFSAGSGEQQVFLGEQIGQQRDHSEATARAADEEVRRILDEAGERARATLGENREGLDRIAELLVEKEEITGEDVLRVLGVSRNGGSERKIAAKVGDVPASNGRG